MRFRSRWLQFVISGALLLLAVIVGGWLMMPEQLEISNLWVVLRRNNLELATQLKDAVVQSDSDVVAIGETRGLPIIELRLSRKDIAHFGDLYAKYEDPKFGIAYYAKHNLWRKAKLTYEGRTYEVKVKSHGRSPTNHRSGRYISLAIKMPRGEHIRNSRRFSLLVRDHFVPKKQVVFDVADYFGLFKNQEELFRVKINNWDEKLFFFDRRLNDSFMEVEGRPSLRVFGYSFSDESTNKSSVYTGGEFDEQAYRKRFRQTLIEKEYPESQHGPLTERFVAFNKMLSEGKLEQLEEFCDMDYISSFQAFRLICGLVGHLARYDNLYVFYDTANGKFYPIVTRDCWVEKMQLLEGGSAELFVDTAGPWEQPFFKMLSRDLDVRRAAYEKIYQYMQEIGPTIDLRHRKLLERYDKLSYFGWATVGLRNAGFIEDDYTAHNLRVLQYFFDDCAPRVKISIDTNKMLLSVATSAMPGIRVDQLSLAVNERTSPMQVPVSVWGEFIEGNETHPIPVRTGTARVAGGRIRLGDSLKDFDLIAPLTEKTNRVLRLYNILVKLESDAFSFVDEAVELAIKNGVTGNPVLPESAAVQFVPFDEGAFPQVLPRRADDAWRSSHPDLRMDVAENVVTLMSGEYDVNSDLILPKTHRLVIEPGTTLRLGEGVAIGVYRGIDVRGTQDAPVVITAQNPQEPFGSLGVLGDGQTTSTLQHLHVSGGYERWVAGVYFSGAVSIHDHASVSLDHCRFENNLADDGLNVKHAEKVVISNCVFRDNAADQIDLDFCQGVVQDSEFRIANRRDANGDGLDVSGSGILVRENRFEGFPDKGMSVGERSRIELRNNRFESNTAAIAVKDSSQATLVGNDFSGNQVDVDGFQKKSIFGGGHIWFNEPPSPKLKIYLDKKSTAYTAQSLSVFANAVSNLQQGKSINPSEGWRQVAKTVQDPTAWRVPPDFSSDDKPTASNGAAKGDR